MNDPRTTTQADAALLAKLVSEIVEPEVLGPMEKLGWGHGEPPAPERTTATVDNPPVVETIPLANPKPEANATPANPVTPAATPAATQSTTEIDWEALKDPTTGLYAGKYTTPAEAAKGLAHLAAMTRTIREDRDRLLRERQTQPVTAVATVEAPKTVPSLPQSGLLDEVLAKITEDGGTLDENSSKALKEAILSEATAAAQKIVSARDAAVEKENAIWNDVDTHMRAKFPESFKFTEEIALFKQTDPVVGAAVDALIASGKAKEATELAYTSFVRARDAQVIATVKAETEKKEVTLEAAEAVRKEAVEAARRDAGVSTTTAGGVHENPAVGISQDEIAQVAAAMQRGDPGAAVRWRDLVFGSELKGPLFD